MFVKRVGEMRANGEEMVVANGGARTVRALTAADGMGFSFSDVGFSAGAVVDLWYKHHWEANYILTGTGRVEDLGTGEAWPIESGSLYNRGGRRTATASPPRPISTSSACFARRFGATSSTMRTVRSSRAGRCRRGLPDTDGRFAMTSAFAATSPVSWCVASR